ncbi:VaFE repeat-containing surface-anchored protein [Corynebacterium marquesiae]|uniref:VaFE repeat-containing surface-anchored protein n=1 Tax=Corynebacterium marquesiae TaxID=2913503 RepID=UPI0038D011F4
MSRLKNISREGWMVFTAVLAAIAVIAAMVTVPGGKAGAAEPSSFQPSEDLAGEYGPGVDVKAIEASWGTLTYAGKNNAPNSKNDIGWAWCIDPSKIWPTTNGGPEYLTSNAQKLEVKDEYRNAAISIALKWQEALRQYEEAQEEGLKEQYRKKAATYVIYLQALTSWRPSDRTRAVKTITGADPTFENPDGEVNFPAFSGSMEEFTRLTGLKLERAENPGDRITGGPSFTKVAEIETYPDEYYITIVVPGPSGSYYEGSAQRLLPPDQPGLPDNPDNGGGSEESTTSPENPDTEENTTEETTSENPEGETSSTETTSDSEPSDSEGTTTDETDEPTPSKTTDVVPNPEPTPTSSEQEKKLEPKISTNADFEDGSHEVVAGAKIVDEVTYEGLVPEKEYTLKAELISKADGKTVLGKGEKTFTPKKSEGKEPVTITVNDDVTEPVEAAVAFEELTSTEVNKDGKDTPDTTPEKPNHVAEHKDIKDEDQTVTSKKTPKISTNADFEDGSHEVVAGAKIVDEVTYEGLVPEKEYTLKAELISKADGKTVLGKGEKTFTPKKSEGKEPVTITVNDDVTEPVEAAVAFEELTSTEVNKDGKDTPDTTPEKPNHVAEHKDIKDEDQTVTSKKTPKISTNADFEDGSHEVVAGAKIVDEVTYEGLVPEKEYTLKAELISKADGKTVLGKGEKTFTPKKSEGKEPVTITVNDDVTEPVEAAVAFEELTSTEVNKDGKDTPDTTPEKPNHVAEHKDIKDEDQTVTSKKTPKISTNADFEDGSHEVVAGAKIVDEVTYEGLVPEKEYTLKAELISKADGKTVLGKGEKTFTPKKSEGKEPVTITVNDDVTEPVEAAVAFEELTSTEVNKDGKDTPDTTPEKPNHVAEHKDIKDEDQTVTSKKTPKISTNADFEDGSHEVVAGAKIVDEVTYEGLVPEKEYTLKAELISKADGKTVLGKGEKTFTPKKSEGKEPVTITVNDDVTEPVEAAVAFEELTSTEVNKDGKDTPDTTPEKPNHVAEHKDIKDEDQTVTSKKTPKISTNADFEDGSHEVVAGAKIVDEVTYEGLVPEKEYTLKAELISKADGKTVLGKGEKTFTPKKSEGKEPVTITVNDDVTEPVEAAVAFEELTSTEVNKDGKDTPDTTPEKPNHVAEHKDINDKDQTVPKDGGGHDTPGTDTPGTDTPGTDTPGTDTPGTDTPGTDTPGTDTPGTDTPGTDTPGTDTPGTDTPGTDTPGTDTPGTDTPGTDTPGTDTPGTDTPGTDTPGTDTPGTDTPGTDTPGTDTPGTDTPAEPAPEKPKISTNADFEDGSHEVVAGAKIVDEVTYEGLVPEKEYTLKAELISKADGKTVLGKGEKTFTPKKSEGKEPVTITVNDDVTEPVEAAVAFEELTSTEVNKDGKDTPDTTPEKPNHVAEHKDIKDEDQTVTSKKTPKISTNADFEDGSHEVVAGAKIVDEVTYEGLVPEKEYTLKAELISKADGKTVLGKGEKTFTPKKSEGKEPVTITVNDDVTEPVEAAVAFEELTSTEVNKDGKDTPDTTPEKPNHVAEHKDINDKDQTVPKDGGGHDTPGTDTPGTDTPGTDTPGTDTPGTDTPGTDTPGTDTPGTDTPGTDTPGTDTPGTDTPGTDTPGTDTPGTDTPGTDTPGTDTPGTDTPGTDTPGTDTPGTDTPGTDTPGTDTPGTDTPGTDTPAEPAPEKPKISTNADFEDGSHEVVAGAKIVDEVTYEGLVPEKEYTLKAELISKADGKTVLGKGEKTFTPKKSEGKEPVTITVNDDVTEPVEAAVAFEELTSTEVNKDGKDTPDTTPEKPNHVAEHKDIKDEDQTVTSKKTPKISTNADFEDGSHEVVAGAKIVDEVTYEGLVPEKEYTLKAELISKADGKTVLGKGEKTFTPKKSEGKEPVTITVNDDVTEPVEAAVAFEELTSTEVNKDGKDTPDTTPEKPNHVAEHKDINDKDQTVPKDGGGHDTPGTDTPGTDTPGTDTPGTDTPGTDTPGTDTPAEPAPEKPKISTNADFEDGSHEVVAGAKIVDKVTYEGLVPEKEYTLKAELISKADGKTVLGKGEKTFTPKKSKGMEPVTITVNDDVKEPVQAAVAFEELTSTEVNDKGEDTPDTTPEKPNHIAEHKDIHDEDQTVISHEVEGQKPGDGGSSHGSSKDSKWWLILIPGIGLGKIIKDHFDHKDHGNHNGGHGDNTGNHDGGNGKHTDGHNGGNGHEVKGQDAPQGGNSDNGHGRGVEVQGQEPEETGNALPSNAERVEIKSVPSGATELEPGMQDYIK